MNCMEKETQEITSEALFFINLQNESDFWVSKGSTADDRNTPLQDRVHPAQVLDSHCNLHTYHLRTVLLYLLSRWEN